MSGEADGVRAGSPLHPVPVLGNQSITSAPVWGGKPPKGHRLKNNIVFTGLKSEIHVCHQYHTIMVVKISRSITKEACLFMRIRRKKFFSHGTPDSIPETILVYAWVKSMTGGYV